MAQFFGTPQHGMFRDAQGNVKICRGIMWTSFGSVAVGTIFRKQQLASNQVIYRSC
jgi:hypothetical protein